MNPAEGKLHALLEFFTASRQVGHTAAALDGVRNTPGARLIVPFHADARRLKALGVETVVLSGESMRGRSFPTVIDNHTAAHVATEALGRIDQLKAECKEITRAKDAEIKRRVAERAEALEQLESMRRVAENLLAALKRIDPGPDWTVDPEWHDGAVFCEITVGDIRALRAAIAAAEGKELLSDTGEVQP